MGSGWNLAAHQWHKDSLEGEVSVCPSPDILVGLAQLRIRRRRVSEKRIVNNNPLYCFVVAGNDQEVADSSICPANSNTEGTALVDLAAHIVVKVCGTL